MLIKKVSFALFDTGETVLGALVFSTAFPLFITRHVDTKLYSLLYGLALLCSFFLALYLGKLADRLALRKGMFGIFGTLTALLCASIGVFYGFPQLTLILFLLMAISHQQAFVFYNSMLLGFESRGITSGMGVAFGYVGSAIALLFLAERLKGAELYIVVATLFFMLALPSFTFLENPPQTSEVRIKELLKERRFILLMVSILMVTEVANTLIAMMGVYLREVYSFELAQVYKVIGISALGGVVGGITWGYLIDRFGPKRIFPAGFFLWSGFLVSLPFVPRELVLIVGFLAGISLSHLWTSSRVLLLETFPQGQASVRLSFLSLSERIASTAGLSLWALLLLITGDDFRLSASALGVFPLVGYLIFRKALK